MLDDATPTLADIVGDSRDPVANWQAVKDHVASGRALIILREQVEDRIGLSQIASAAFCEQYPISGNWLACPSDFIMARAAAQEALAEQQKAAEIALAAALIELEPDLPLQKDGPRCAIAPNGLLHVTITGDVVIPEGVEIPGYRTSAEAIAAWKRGLLEYAATHDGDTLWWRKRPEIQGEIPFGKTTARWIVYSRLMIGNQADTLLARIAAGTLAPTRMMIEDDMVTAEQLAELGWVLNEISNCPVLAKFDAPKLSPAVKLAYASAIDVLPPIISVLPDEISYVRKHISTSASKTSLADTINVWATQLLSQIGDANPTWLHWHTAPYAWAFENGGNLWTISSVCTVMWSEDRAAA